MLIDSMKAVLTVGCCIISLSAKTPQSSSASNSHRLEVWAQRLVHDIPIHQKYTNTLEEWATGMSLWIRTSAFPLSYRRCVFMTYGTILQQSLNEFREAHNAHVIRKQRGVELPTGHSPNAMWFQPQVLDAGIYASHWSRGVTSLWGLNKNWIALFFSTLHVKHHCCRKILFFHVNTATWATYTSLAFGVNKAKYVGNRILQPSKYVAIEFE